MANISPLAYVHPEAQLGENVTIDAFAYIDRDVVIGDGCRVRPHASVLAGARLGKNCTVYEGAVVSASPQDFRWKKEDSFVIIGDNVTIREYVIINRSIRQGKATEIGEKSFVLAQTHVGHDSVIGKWCVLGNAVKIAGDVRIGDYSILSSNSLVHEKCHVGEWVMIKGGCRVTSHVPPYVIMAHNPISYYGVNAYILRKGNHNEELIDDIAKCYRHIYQCHTSPFNALKRIEEDVKESPQRDQIVTFIRSHDYKIAALPLDVIGE